MHAPCISSTLPDGLAARSIEIDGRRDHNLTLPNGPARETVRFDERTVHLRGSEVGLLERAGRFRVTLTADLQADAGGSARADEDVRSLVRQGLLAERTISRLEDGTHASVVS